MTWGTAAPETPAEPAVGAQGRDGRRLAGCHHDAAARRELGRWRTALGLSPKREIARTSIRVRTAMAVQTLELGRYLGGRPPYGYRLADAGPHPNKATARGPAPAGDPAVPERRRYLLAGLLVCGTCGRRMESAWSHGKASYRCRHGHTSAAPPDPGQAIPRPCPR